MDVIPYLEKRFNYTDYSKNNIEEYENEIIEYFDCKINGEEVELKVSYDKKGHHTYFEIEQKKLGSEDWYFLTGFEEYI